MLLWEQNESFKQKQRVPATWHPSGMYCSYMAHRALGGILGNITAITTDQNIPTCVTCL